MKVPIIQGIIDRRLLINFRVKPEVLSKILPHPFCPKLVHGFGMAGICLIRFKKIRPKFFPSLLGFYSENAAHRIAVEWKENGVHKEGVYVPRRDTNSRLNTLVGGRLFPGIQHHAHFVSHDEKEHYEVSLKSDDSTTEVSVKGHLTQHLPKDSVFVSLEEASEFFKNGSLGYSASKSQQQFQGMELCCQNWEVEAFAVEEVHSSFFEDIDLFPKGSVDFDCGLIMRNIHHSWHSRKSLCG